MQKILKRLSVFLLFSSDQVYTITLAFVDIMIHVISVHVCTNMHVLHLPTHTHTHTCLSMICFHGKALSVFTALANKDMKRAEMRQSEVIHRRIDTNTYHTEMVLYGIFGQQSNSQIITAVSHSSRLTSACLFIWC